MTMPEARLPTGGGAAPDASRLRRVCVVATVVLAFTTTGLGIWVLSGQDRSGESTLPTLEFLRLGDGAESPYCLPYPEGESHYINNSYSTRGSHIGRFAYDFAMPFGAEIAVGASRHRHQSDTTGTATTIAAAVTRTASSSFTTTAQWLLPPHA